jgi:hypothetical protein
MSTFLRATCRVCSSANSHAAPTSRSHLLMRHRSGFAKTQNVSLRRHFGLRVFATSRGGFQNFSATAMG